MAAPKAERKIPVWQCLDFETSGLDFNNKNAITEIGVYAIRMDTLETIGQYQAFVKPYYKAIPPVKKLKSKQEIAKEEAGILMDYDDKAEATTGITVDFLLENGLPIEEVVNSYLEFTKETTLSKGNGALPVLCGQNIAGFDTGFWIHMMERTGKTKEASKLFQGMMYGNLFIPSCVDSLFLARAMFANNESIENHKLATISEALGIEIIDAHGAIQDVDATTDIFRVMVERMRNEGGASSISAKAKDREHFKI